MGDNMKKINIIFCFKLLLVTLFSNAVNAQNFYDKSINEIISLTCNKKILLFGEASHADGATLELKNKIIPRLVNECGYKAIVFEAPIYDFSKLSLITKPSEKYDRNLFLSAWGGMWNQYKEVSNFANFIATKSPKELKIFGMDIQNASRGAFYTIYKMPIELSNIIENIDERERCKKLLDVQNRNWVDDAPIVKPANECLEKIIKNLEGKKDENSKFLVSMAKADMKANKYIELNPALLSDTRDTDMANNVIDFYEKMPKNSKIIVWTAAAHASYGGLYKGHSVGQILKEKYKNKVFSLGVSAASGKLAYHNDKIPEYINPKPNSLEANFDKNKDVTILNKKKLQEISEVEGQVLLAHEVKTQNWSKLFDAILILKEEHPATRISDEWIEWKDKSEKYKSIKQ